MDLTVILPAYNEAHRIVRGVEKVAEWLQGYPAESEILVVDDGSTDGTGEILTGLQDGLPNLRCARLPVNRGKGAAVRTGVAEARGRLVLFTDVDQSTPIEETPKLIRALENGLDAAIGSREVLGARRLRPQPLYRRFMGSAFVLLRGRIVLDGYNDTQCGFKLFRGEVAKDVFPRGRIDRFCFDVEILAIARHRGYRVAEIPVRWYDDPRSRVSLLSDPALMILDLFRIRRNRARGIYG